MACCGRPIATASNRSRGRLVPMAESASDRIIPSLKDQQLSECHAGKGAWFLAPSMPPAYRVARASASAGDFSAGYAAEQPNQPIDAEDHENVSVSETLFRMVGEAV
jgi:hypothetical protein